MFVHGLEPDARNLRAVGRCWHRMSKLALDCCCDCSAESLLHGHQLPAAGNKYVSAKPAAITAQSTDLTASARMQFDCSLACALYLAMHSKDCARESALLSIRLSNSALTRICLGQTSRRETSSYV